MENAGQVPAALMDEDQSGRPRNGAGTNATDEGPRAESGGLIGWVKRMFGFGRSDETLRESLEGVLDRHAEEDGTDSFRADAKSMMLNLIEFSGLRVDDVLVPRAEIIAVDAGSTVAELLEYFLDAGHSRLPIYRDTLDEPVGMVHIKDFLGWLNSKGKRRSNGKAGAKGAGGWSLSATDLKTQVSELGIMRELLYVPPSMPAPDLLIKMQSTHCHMAIVVDEYGGTDGLLTIEDLVEEIVGDIADEHDEKDELISQVSETSWLADAKTEIEDAEELLGIELLSEDEEEEADTLGGLVFHMLGRVPVRGELIRHPSGIEFEIVAADPRRVRRIAIHAGRPAKTETKADLRAEATGLLTRFEAGRQQGR
jgi:CBS domain containing-hemolysin-like protein